MTLEGAANNMCVCRSLAIILAGALVTAACGGGSVAPVVERSATGSGSGLYPGTARATAGSEASDSDWTATVRPLGDPGSTASRELPSEVPAAAAAGTNEPAPTSTRNSQVTAPAPGGASSAVNPAVVSLLNTASAQSGAGDHARAAATLERAIAIEPDNAWLWHRLAVTRLDQGHLEQAATLAAKSNSLANSMTNSPANSLAVTDRSLQADNWKLIAEARRRQGDTGAAAAAESQAARLSN